VGQNFRPNVHMRTCGGTKPTANGAHIEVQRATETAGTLRRSRDSERSRQSSSNGTAGMRSSTGGTSEPPSNVERVNAVRDHLAFVSAQQEQSATHTHSVLGASVGLTVGAIAGYARPVHQAKDCHWSESLATDVLRDRCLSCTARSTQYAC